MLILDMIPSCASAFTLTLFYSPFYIDFLFIFDMAIDWISYTYSVHLIVCKFQVCVSVFICSSLSMTSSCVCSHCSMFHYNMNTYHSSLTSCSFLTWLSIGFLMHTRFISQLVSSSLCICVYMLIFVNDFLLHLLTLVYVCQSNMNTHDSALISCVHFRHDFQLDFLFLYILGVFIS